MCLDYGFSAQSVVSLKAASLREVRGLIMFLAPFSCPFALAHLSSPSAPLCSSLKPLGNRENTGWLWVN